MGPLCARCQEPMRLLFVAYSCDYCEGGVSRRDVVATTGVALVMTEDKDRWDMVRWDMVGYTYPSETQSSRKALYGWEDRADMLVYLSAEKNGVDYRYIAPRREVLEAPDPLVIEESAG